MKVKYYITRNGMYWDNHPSVGTLNEEYPTTDDYVNIDKYTTNNPNLELSKEEKEELINTKINEPDEIIKWIEKGYLKKGYWEHSRFDDYYTTIPISCYKWDTFNSYEDAQIAIDRRNWEIKNHNLYIESLSEYDYSVKEVNEWLFLHHCKHLNKLIWDYIDSVDMKCFHISCDKGTVMIVDDSGGIIPYYDKSTNKTSPVCGLIMDSDWDGVHHDFECKYYAVNLNTMQKYHDIINKYKYHTKKDIKNNKKIDDEVKKFIKDIRENYKWGC